MLTLCLVNTYDRIRLHEIHLRTIARAMPLCYAFEFHLALMHFDFWDNEKEMVSEIREYTTIGKNGLYAEKLLNKGWIHLIDNIQPQFGRVVATTSKPDKRKEVKWDNLFDILSGSAIFLVGLGRKGLPEKLHRRAEYHFDVTFRGISLETCTAIGSILTFLHIYRERQPHKS